MSEHYDAVVVGAGPAGSAAAYAMAKNGLKVALLERGEYPGAKNMFGGTLYSEAVASLFPAFWESAPLERPVVRDEVWFLDDSSAVTLGFTGLHYAQPPYNKFTVLRSRFDQWLAWQAQQAGALLFPSCLVTDLRWEGSFAAGVVTEQGDIFPASAVVLAEGALALLAEKAGMRGPLEAHSFTIYVRLTFSLPAARLEERFQLEPGEGADLVFIGYPTAGSIGKAGLFTNKDSVSLVTGVYLDELVQKGASLPELAWRTRSHPLVRRLLDGAILEEYQAHMLPKGGFRQIPRLYGDGLLVAGDAAMLISGRHGADLALLSGQLAGETVAQAKAKGDFSRKMMAVYAEKLKNTFYYKNMQAAGDTLDYYKQHQDADFLLSKALNGAAYRFFAERMLTDREKREMVLKELAGIQTPIKDFSDIWQGLQHWRVL